MDFASTPEPAPRGSVRPATPRAPRAPIPSASRRLTFIDLSLLGRWNGVEGPGSRVFGAHQGIVKRADISDMPAGLRPDGGARGSAPRARPAGTGPRGRRAVPAGDRSTGHPRPPAAGARRHGGGRAAPPQGKGATRPRQRRWCAGFGAPPGDVSRSPSRRPEPRPPWAEHDGDRGAQRRRRLRVGSGPDVGPGAGGVHRGGADDRTACPVTATASVRPREPRCRRTISDLLTGQEAARPGHPPLTAGAVPGGDLGDGTFSGCGRTTVVAGSLMVPFTPVTVSWNRSGVAPTEVTSPLGPGTGRQGHRRQGEGRLRGGRVAEDDLRRPGSTGRPVRDLLPAVLRRADAERAVERDAWCRAAPPVRAGAGRVTARVGEDLDLDPLVGAATAVTDRGDLNLVPTGQGGRHGADRVRRAGDEGEPARCRDRRMTLRGTCSNSQRVASRDSVASSVSARPAIGRVGVAVTTATGASGAVYRPLVVSGTVAVPPSLDVTVTDVRRRRRHR